MSPQTKEDIGGLFSGITILCQRPCKDGLTGSHWSVHLEADDLRAAVTRLDAAGYFIEDVCGVDTEEGFDVVYHFDRWSPPGRITLRVLVPHDNPRVPSIAGIFPGADWHERETYDFYGIVFTGHPNLAPLLLDEELKEHPLVKAEKDRKSVKQLFHLYKEDDCKPMIVRCSEGTDSACPAPEAGAASGGGEAS